MKHIKKKHTPEEILNLVNGHLEKGEESKAKYLMTLTTGLGIKDKKDVVQGLRKLKVEDITKTDLTDINKFGCSFGAAAVLLVSFSIIYNLVF
jgi:ribosomal protein L7/L12